MVGTPKPHQCSTLNQTSAGSAVVVISFAAGDSFLDFLLSDALLAGALRLGAILSNVKLDATRMQGF